jgi:hypothetical protein
MDEWPDRYPWLPAVGVVGGIALITALVFYARGVNLASDKAFGVAEENVKTQTFQHSEAYVEGVRRDCEELKLAYVQAKTPDEKTAVLSTLRHRVEGVDPTIIPADVKELLK